MVEKQEEKGHITSAILGMEGGEVEDLGFHVEGYLFLALGAGRECLFSVRGKRLIISPVVMGEDGGL